MKTPQKTSKIISISINDPTARKRTKPRMNTPPQDEETVAAVNAFVLEMNKDKPYHNNSNHS